MIFHALKDGVCGTQRLIARSAAYIIQLKDQMIEDRLKEAGAVVGLLKGKFCSPGYAKQGPHYMLTGKRIILLVLFALLLQSCASLPPRPDLPYEPALAPTSSGRIAELSERVSEKFAEGESGFKLLIDSWEAYATRLALIDLATSAIDLQYFIWKGDAAGLLLFDRLIQAADRGVKVRIIVDDIWLSASARDFSAMNLHPNLEIRIFNPIPSDDTISATFHYLNSFKKYNRRMHNKLMIVDNHVAVAGGRNIGNEYFGLGKKFNFLDIDVLAIGPLSKECSDAFDTYWNDNAVYPPKDSNSELSETELDEISNEITQSLRLHFSRLRSYPLHFQSWSSLLDKLEKKLVPGEGYLLQDDPVQIDGRDYRLVDMISYFSQPTRRELIVSTPYLIPVDDMLERMGKIVESGAEIKIITNSLESTNHTLVNSHYKKYRRPILETGTRLYEFRAQPADIIRTHADVEPVVSPFISLHAKTMVSDSSSCFIGSLNFDPRALVINTENGLLIESEILAGQLSHFLNELLEPDNAYHLTINESNTLEWNSIDGTTASQPSRGLGQRIADFLGWLLPVEDQL